MDNKIPETSEQLQENDGDAKQIVSRDPEGYEVEHASRRYSNQQKD